MRTTEEVTHGDYRGVLQALVDARAPSRNGYGTPTSTRGT